MSNGNWNDGFQDGHASPNPGDVHEVQQVEVGLDRFRYFKSLCVQGTTSGTFFSTKFTPSLIRANPGDVHAVQQIEAGLDRFHYLSSRICSSSRKHSDKR